jgi:hypothetical protein
MKITIVRDGLESLVDIDLDPRNFTMRELVRLEEELGGEATERFMSGDVVLRPTLIRAVIWAKLLNVAPDISLEQFDVDLGELEAWVEEAAKGGLPLSQSVDGETEEVIVGKADEDT